MATESPIAQKEALPTTFDNLDIVVANPPFGVICIECRHALPPAVQRRVKVWPFDRWGDISWDRMKGNAESPLLVISRLADIPEDAAIESVGHRDRKYLLFVEDMPVEAISSRIPRLHIRDAQRLHIARERDKKDISAIISRAIGGIAFGKQHTGIVDAWIEDDDLVVLFPAFDRLRVPLSKLTKHLGTNKDEIRAFEIDEDGSFLYWPHADVHLGPDQLHAIVDPTSAVTLRQKSAQFNKEYGEAIRSLREERGLKQTAIEGITDRHLRRIEQGQLPVTSGVLQSLARAHGMEISQYMAELAKRVSQK